MKPFSQFIDARLGCVAAAEALFGVRSQQALKTADAFDAVELYDAPTSAAQLCRRTQFLARWEVTDL